MQIQQLSVKIFAHQRALEPGPLIEIFHRWIQERRLGDAVLIDVADYSHVPDGPGILLIGDAGHYALDAREGELGLQYARKRDPVGAAGPRLKEAFGAALRACVALAAEPALGGSLTFDAGRVEVRIMSRLVAPQGEASYAAFAPLLQGFLAELYGGAGIELEHRSDPGQPFTVRARVAGQHDLARLASLL